MRLYRLHDCGKIDSKTVFCQKFKDLIDYVIYNAKRVSSPTMIQLVFDSYTELTIKDSGRLKGGFHVTYELPDIYPCTALPSMIESLWKSDSSNRKLIDCAYEYYLEHPIKAKLTLVCSGYLIPKEDTWKTGQQSLRQNV